MCFYSSVTDTHHLSAERFRQFFLVLQVEHKRIIRYNRFNLNLVRSILVQNGRDLPLDFHVDAVATNSEGSFTGSQITMKIRCPCKGPNSTYGYFRFVVDETGK